MFSVTASTRQPPAGGPGGAPRLDGLLRELRRGEREAFVQYFQLLRSPVYDFARRLLGDEREAVAATTAAFVAAFRQVILDEGVTDLWVVTCRCAFEACVDRSAALGAGSTAEPIARQEAPRSGRGGPSDASRRFGAALETLPIRRRAALLLDDTCGLSLVQMAAVFSVSEEAAGALLFRAREEFRQAFDERSADARAGRCRQAEQAAAGAVGLGLGEDALRRLHRHAAYCRSCRAVMKTWGAAPVGLAVLLKPLTLPQALAAPPVFGGIAEPGDVTPVVGASVLGRGLRATGRFLRSRAAAYAVAVACVALAGGLALHEGRARTFFFAQSVGPAIRLVVQPPADTGQPRQHAGQSKSPRPSSTGSQSASVHLVSSSPARVASKPAVVASSREGAAAGTPARPAATSTDKGADDASAASSSAAADASAASSSAAADALASRADRWTAAQKRQGGTRAGTRHAGTRHAAARHYGLRDGGSGQSADKRTGRRARADHATHRRVHRASAPHRAHGAAHRSRSHVSRPSSRGVHAHDSRGRQGRTHANKNR